MQDPQRILLVRLSHLGDVVHALGVLHALHAAFPRAEIGWAIQPEFAPLLRGLPGLTRVLHFERRGGLGAWLRLRREMRSFRPDLAVDAQGNAKSAAVTFLSGAKRRVGLARGDWREPLAARVLTDEAAPAPDDRPHAMDRMSALVSRVAPGQPLRRDPGLGEEERRAGRRLLASLLPEGTAPLLVQLSSPGDVRGWPEVHWRTLAKALESEGRPALFVSGPGEAALGQALARDFPTMALRGHVIDQRDPRALAGLLFAVGERGGRFLGCDSGPLHLAAACDVPCLLLAGPQDARRTGPWSPTEPSPHVTLRRVGPLDCAPCLARACALPEGPRCMKELDPAAVLHALADPVPGQGVDESPGPG